MRGRRRWIVGLAVGLSAGVLALVVARYYPAYQAALDARDDLRAAQELLSKSRLDVSEDGLARAEGHLSAAEGGFRSAKGTFSDPLLRAAGALPLVGASLDAPATLAEIGLEGTLAGRDAIEVTRAYQRQRDGAGGPLTGRVVELLIEIEPSMAALQERLGRIRRARDRLDGARLPAGLAGAMRELDEELVDVEELLDTYRHLSALLPAFLGMDGPRTYLVLAQNNAELLPTGGLISVYGLITLEEGRVREQRFEDALAFGADWLGRTGAYVEPPPPLQRYLLKGHSWNLALANWSPHYPSAARQAARFYQLGGGEPVDGVIAINVRTIEELLRVTGPVPVESYGVTVTSENALDVIEERTRSASEPAGDRKAFVGLLAEELLSRLMHTPPERWTALVEALERLRDGRQLLLSLDDPALQRTAAGLGLDGALAQPDGDYLMLVDASVQSTKLNVALKQRLNLSVRVDEAGAARHRLAVHYRNALPEWSRGRDPALVERLMLSGVYGGYVRLLAPYGSRLQSVTLAGREVGPEEVSSEHGKAAFGRFFSLVSGEETELGYRYVTRRVVRPDGDALVYRLYIQKQAGTGPLPLSIALGLPYRADVESVELDGEPVDHSRPIVTDLARDRELVARYRLDP